jgi:hypothetical protein
MSMTSAISSSTRVCTYAGSAGFGTFKVDEKNAGKAPKFVAVKA